MNKRYRQIVRIIEKCEKMRHYYYTSNVYEPIENIWKYNAVVDLQERAINALPLSEEA